jgi:transmembrane sensor
MNNASSPDQNQRLAERIGRLRAEGRSLEELRPLDDDLMSVLLTYRDAVAAEAVAPSPETTRRLWDRVASKMAEAETDASRRDRPARQPDRGGHRSASRLMGWRLAVGVAVLLAVGVVAWLLWSASGGRLVAEATTQIATYETATGDTVRLRPNSRLYRVRDNARFRLEGEALFDVAPRAEAPFAVEADGVVVRVLGTRFTVQAWTPRPSVYLDEGRVEMRNVATGDTAALRPGQTGTIAADGTVSVQAARADAYVDWLDRQVAFDSQPAAAVAAELEHHYDLRIRLPDSVAKQTLTGRLLLEDRGRALEDFGRVLGGRFEVVEGTYRFRPDG